MHQDSEISNALPVHLLRQVYVECLFGSLGRSLGRSWAALGRSWALLGRSWGALGPLLGALGDDFCVNVRSSRIFHGFLIDFWSILEYFLRDFKGFRRQRLVRLHVFLRRGHIVKTLKNHRKNQCFRRVRLFGVT